jgi:hypothetical protein
MSSSSQAWLFGSGSIPACAGDGSCSRPVPFIGGKYYWGVLLLPAVPARQRVLALVRLTIADSDRRRSRPRYVIVPFVGNAGHWH